MSKQKSETKPAPQTAPKDPAGAAQDASQDEDSMEYLKALAGTLGIPSHERMSREDLLYAIHKAQGGDGGLSI
jgi:hypothetical protein